MTWYMKVIFFLRPLSFEKFVWLQMNKISSNNYRFLMVSIFGEQVRNISSGYHSRENYALDLTTKFSISICRARSFARSKLVKFLLLIDTDYSHVSIFVVDFWIHICPSTSPAAAFFLTACSKVSRIITFTPTSNHRIISNSY